MSIPSSLFARSAPPGDPAGPEPQPDDGPSLFARSTPRVRTVALDDIVDDLLASRLTRLTQLEPAPSPAAAHAPARDEPADDDHFDDLDDVVALDLVDGDDLDPADDDFDDDHLRQLEDLLDLDEIDAHHVATRDDQGNDPRGDGEHAAGGELVRQSRIIRNRWDVRDRRVGLEQRSGPGVDLRDRFSVTDREAAESLSCLVEWLLARPVVTDLARATPRGLFSLHALGRAGAHAGHLGGPRALDRFVTFET